MTNPTEFSFHPDLGLDAEIAGVQGAAAISRAISDAAEQERGAGLSTNEAALIFDAFAPGIAHFHSFVVQAGELAGQGDAIGALTLLGGEKNARDLIGDHEVELLLEEIRRNIPDSPGF